MRIPHARIKAYLVKYASRENFYRTTHIRRICKCKLAVVDSNFAAGAASWQSGQNIASCCLILAHRPHHVKTSFTKPEIHILLFYRQRRTEPRPQASCTYTDNFVKFGYVFLRYASGQTDKQTYTL